MLNKVIKSSFAIVGAITGFTLIKTFFSVQSINTETDFKLFIAVSIVAAISTAVIFYSTSNKIIELILELMDKLESTLKGMTLYELTVSAVGLMIGLIVANLVTIPINKVDVIGVPLSILANILFGCLGICIAAGKKNEMLFDHFGDRNGGVKGKKSAGPKFLDTSVVIDGRIVDICRTGFIEGELVIPGFVLEELRRIADSSDVLKRNRGRRGFDVLNILQKELNFPVRVEDTGIAGEAEVDDMLLSAAKKVGGTILTVDYNLNKMASFEGVTVLNINELANAVKPIALPGEEISVQVIKDGKENGQGIAYLDDGTMIVVDGGRRHMGEVVNVTVTSILQTAAGRMIFAKPKYTIERVV